MIYLKLPRYLTRTNYSSYAKRAVVAEKLECRGRDLSRYLPLPRNLLGENCDFLTFHSENLGIKPLFNPKRDRMRRLFDLKKESDARTNAIKPLLEELEVIEVIPMGG